MPHASASPAGPARRTVVATAGAAGLTAALAACGGSGGNKKSGASQPATQQPSAQAPAQPPATSSAQPGTSKKPGAVLAKTSEIPVGGGKVFPEHKVVVVQPARGTFKAFSAVCTHEGCVVSKVAAGTIDCPCHGSKFAVADGGVQHGPARKPLPPERISVSGDSITLG
ncbi:hypothetical protein VR41_09360 [Streptomyces sp. NRRL B-1568]|nr:hypothetical protein VR41_09360 [Streptomyces sp. NRRL B-1568]